MYRDEFSSFMRPWINDYGYNEGYIYRSIQKSMTGHLWRGSAMETDSSCGNCDGARCDHCKPKWTVTFYAPPHLEIDPVWGDTIECVTVVEEQYFDDEAKAQEYYDSLANREL